MSATERTSAPWHPSIDPAAWREAQHDPRVIIADGSSVKITVRDGHLSVEDGPPRARRERRFARVSHNIDRLVILAGHGYRTIEADRWMRDAGITWCEIDVQSEDSPVTAMSPPTREDARLLRSQSLAPATETGLRITRELLSAKLAGQSAVCRDVLRVPGAAHNIDDLAAELNRAPVLDDCRSLEGAAAVAYWQAWADRVTVPFAPVDMMKVPAHWLRFSGRTSQIHPYPRNIHATDPVNAILNYLYRIAETEAVHACHALGLSPLLGILHADKPERDSFALDLIEAVRPFCDRIALGMLDAGLGVPVTGNGKPAYLNRLWFREVRKDEKRDKAGQCKLNAPLTHQLASHAADIGAVIRPHAESAARILANASSGRVAVPCLSKSQVRESLAANRVPPTSNRPARLREGVTDRDVIPDALWDRIRGMLPEPPPGPYGHRKTGRNRDTSRDRETVAAIAAHELIGVPWGLPRVSVSVATCRARLLEYQWSSANGTSVWDRIAGEVQGFGHVAGLLAVNG